MRVRRQPLRAQSPPETNHPASSASRSSGDGRDRCHQAAVPSAYGSARSSSSTQVLLESAEDLLRCRRHLVDEIAAVEIEALRAQKSGAWVALNDGAPGLHTA